jgi:hypothetical protein
MTDQELNELEALAEQATGGAVVKRRSCRFVSLGVGYRV